MNRPRRPIAPDLMAYLTQLATREVTVSTASPRVLLAQARALVAVARAASVLVVSRPAYTIVREGLEYVTPVRRALSRLDNLSALRSRKGGWR